MWLTDDGVAHTVAVPDPRLVVSLETATGQPVAHLPELLVTGLRAAVEELEDACYDEITALAFDAAVEVGFVERVPSCARFRLIGSSPDEQVTSLVGQLSAEPVRWRLDRLMALQDLLDEIG